MADTITVPLEHLQPAGGTGPLRVPLEALEPDFRGENAVDAEGHAVVDPNTLDTFAKHVYAGLVSPGQLLPFPKAAGGSGADHPLGGELRNPQYAPNFLMDMHRVKQEGDRLWAKGDAGSRAAAVAKYIESVIPLLGPMASHEADLLQQGKGAALGGDLFSMLFPAGVAKAAEALPALRTPALMRGAALTPEDAGSNALAVDRGIPLSAADATGSRFMRAQQKRVANSMGGEPTATEFNAEQQAALKRVGTELADEAHPEPVRPRQAGGGVRSNLTGSTSTMNDLATSAYDRLRDIEQQPEHARTVQTAAEGSPKYREILGKLSKGWTATGEAMDSGAEAGARVAVKPTRGELIGMRQIETELDAQPYQRGRQVDNIDTNTSYWARGSANADVYHDLHEAMGYGDTLKGPSGAEMQEAIRHTLETGDWNTASKAAYRVAQERFRQNGSLTGPTLPEGAPILGTTEAVQLPVDLRGAKVALKPIYDRLLREAQLAPLMGGKANALRALDRLMSARDYESVSVVDEALGDLKSMSDPKRNGTIPELRTQGQGLAAMAVKELERAVQRTVQGAGPEAVQALQAGRSATIAKYQFGGTLEDLPASDVRAFRRLVEPGDANFEELQKVAAQAPEEVPKIARGYLQRLLDFATERGRFDHADRLYAEWQKLGDDTKSVLFPDAAHRQALDRFFLLAKRVMENPNPSGTAHTLTAFNFGSQPAMYAGAKLLYSPKAVQALSRGLVLDLSRTRIPRTLRAATMAEIATAAREAGVEVPLPKAADQDQDQPAGVR